MIKLAALDLKKLKNYADWRLLLFLLLFLNVKLAVKIGAIIFIYVLQPDLRLGFSFKNSRLPLFYPLVIALSIINFFINGSYGNSDYLFVLLTGIGFWILCILAIHQVKLSVEHNKTEVIHHTVLVFLILNVLFSIANLGSIIWETGALNPYLYQGQHQKYFISTGDYIKGVTFDTSTTNAILNAFGVIYFLVRKNALMMLVCTATMLLTGSNFISLILFIILVPVFIFRSGKDQKSLIAVCLMFLVVFMAKISPQNNRYVAQTFENIFHHHKSLQAPPIAVLPVTERPDSLLSSEERKEKIAILYLDSVHQSRSKIRIHEPAVLDKSIVVTDAGRIYIPGPDINSAPYQNLESSPSEQSKLLTFINTHKELLPLSGHPDSTSAAPGKITGAIQTLEFLKHHPGKIITGAGLGNFSSKLAFRASGLGFAGGYPAKYIYINPAFLVNHLDLYLNFFSKRAGFHSLTNSPFSVYDQLLAEYGVPGLAFLCICYLGFFARHQKNLTYGLPALLLLLAVLFIDYWFEQLSVLVFFELILLLDMKESPAKINGSYEH